MALLPVAPPPNLARGAVAEKPDGFHPETADAVPARRFSA